MNDERGTAANSKLNRYVQSPPPALGWANHRAPCREARRAVCIPDKGNRLQSPHNELVPVLIYVGVGVFFSPLLRLFSGVTDLYGSPRENNRIAVVKSEARCHSGAEEQVLRKLEVTFTTVSTIRVIKTSGLDETRHVRLTVLLPWGDSPHGWRDPGFLGRVACVVVVVHSAGSLLVASL